MDPISQQTALASAGGKKDPVYVDDVFSTFLYEGTGSAQTITNGIDISGEGGLVWLKSRSLAEANVLGDTETGITKRLYSNSSTGQAVSNMLTSANSNGFTLGTSNITNTNNSTNVSWTFRKQKGFFDVVTFSASSNQIPHSLGSTPGMIIVKRTDAASDWFVYHRSFSNPNANYMKLNDSTSVYSGINGNWEATDTYFKFQIFGIGTWVAYIFAHDDAQFGTDGDESIIKCGSFSYTGGTPLNVNLGWEAQWLLVKKSNGNDSWFLVDNMRGMIDGDGAYVQANTANNEGPYGIAGATSTGFIFDPGTQIFSSGDFIYMAIRRPHKPPEVTTEVFAIDTGNSSSTIPAFDSGFPVDFAFRIFLGGGADHRGLARLTGTEQLFPNTTAVSSTDSNVVWDSNEGFGKSESSSFISYMFKRAPGFMDVVAWDGDSASVKNVSHNLEKVPEMVISKMRGPTSGSSSYGGDRWYVYHKNLGTDTGGGSTAINSILGLNQTMSQYSFSGGGIFGSAPTATNLPFDNPSYDSLAVNGSGKKYIAYLFATLPGISKVGSYTGTGSAINVPCGFTNGARFILIKRTNGTGDWYVWDTLRGIVSGNDPYLLLNSTAAQVTNTDYVDPLTSGFTVTASAPAALNVSGGTYIFLAIA